MELLYIYNTTIDFSHHMININFICLYFSITYKIFLGTIFGLFFACTVEST